LLLLLFVVDLHDLQIVLLDLIKFFSGLKKLGFELRGLLAVLPFVKLTALDLFLELNDCLLSEGQLAFDILELSESILLLLFNLMELCDFNSIDLVVLLVHLFLTLLMLLVHGHHLLLAEAAHRLELLLEDSEGLRGLSSLLLELFHMSLVLLHELNFNLVLVFFHRSLHFADFLVVLLG
jgi:hypothetical protein